MISLSPSEVSPALSLVDEASRSAQILFIPDKALKGLPGELDYALLPDGYALGKELILQPSHIHNPSALDIDPAEAGLAVQACPLIEYAIVIDQALGESRWIMGIRINDPIAIGFDGAAGK